MAVTSTVAIWAMDASFDFSDLMIGVAGGLLLEQTIAPKFKSSSVRVFLGLASATIEILFHRRLAGSFQAFYYWTLLVINKNHCLEMRLNLFLGKLLLISGDFINLDVLECFY